MVPNTQRPSTIADEKSENAAFAVARTSAFDNIVLSRAQSRRCRLQAEMVVVGQQLANIPAAALPGSSVVLHHRGKGPKPDRLDRYPIKSLMRRFLAYGRDHLSDLGVSAFPGGLGGQEELVYDRLGPSG